MYDYDRRRFAIEFGTEDALKEYLQAHPKADPKKHSVRDPKEEKKTSSPKAKGKGGAGKQRLDWYKQLSEGGKHNQKMYDAAKQLDYVESRIEEMDPPKTSEDRESTLKWVKENFKKYNEALEETFGSKAKEAEPQWNIPKPKADSKGKGDEKAKAKEKSEKERSESKEKSDKDEDRQPKHHKFPVGLEKKFEKEHGKIKELHFESNHSESDEDNYDAEGLFTVITNKGLFKVVVEDSKIVEVHKERDDEDEDDDK